MSGYAAIHEFDDVTVWLDNDADGILDAADDVQISDDFGFGSISTAFDCGERSVNGRLSPSVPCALPTGFANSSPERPADGVHGARRGDCAASLLHR